MLKYFFLLSCSFLALLFLFNSSSVAMEDNEKQHLPSSPLPQVKKLSIAVNDRHLQQFREKRESWVTKLAEPLEWLVVEIKKNKDALRNINSELATGLNTTLEYDKSSQAWSKVPTTEGVFAISPAQNCETDFLNPLTASFQKILLRVKIEGFFKPLNEEFSILEDLYWSFAYADAWYHPSFSDKDNQAVNAWKQGEGAVLTKYINTAFTLSEDLNFLFSNFPKLNSFLESFSNENRADVNIITIGCRGDAKQQIYPWVIKFAKENTDKKVVIDLFDKWDSVEPEFLGEYKFAWKTEDGGKYAFENIEVNVRTYIPLSEESLHGPGYFVTDFHKMLSTFMRKQLEKNVVIASQHTGDFVLDEIFVTFYNQINIENSDLKQRLFLATHQNFFAAYQGGTSSRAFVYNQTPCNALLNGDWNFDTLRTESLEKNSKTEPKKAKKEDVKNQSKQEDLMTLKLFAPKLWVAEQDYQKWKSERLNGPSPRKTFLSEFDEYSLSYKNWQKDQKNPIVTEFYFQNKARFEGSKLSTLGEVWVKDLFKD